MSRRVRAWLAGRAGPVPPTLQAAMESAADGDAPPDAAGRGGSWLSGALADAGLRALADAVARGDDRAAAYALLAADALATAAGEAATDPGVDTDAALNALCDAFAPARLDDHLPEDAH